ncbi:MAG: hypothetical protein HN608_15645, partial [Rhodospirillaceae bacterium]|nr:hypothetical protein [Rhodospirillaceae bacterium]
AGRDPVSAIAEDAATGETAEIFADIRATMEIPLITSIWRTLYDVPGGLAPAWKLAKPIYETGQPAAALARVVAQADLPVPAPLVPGQLACAGVSVDDLGAIRAIVDAYNRSNGMNMVALTAVVVPPAGSTFGDPGPADAVPDAPDWPELRPLLGQEDIAPTAWQLLNQIRHLGSQGAPKDNAVLATLWRHLAHWPGLLALIQTGFAPLREDGTIMAAFGQVHALAQAEGARLAHLRPSGPTLPKEAEVMIARYVGSPMAVAHMVTLGHALAKWLVPND